MWLLKPETGGVVSNWFDMPDQDLDDIEIEELEITDDVIQQTAPLEIFWKIKKH